MRRSASSLRPARLTPLQCLLTRRWRPQWICHQHLRSQQPWLRRLASHPATATATATTTITTTTTTTPSPAPSGHDRSPKPYYVTTPIFYVNAAPHVGHMYTMILADVLKRWQTLQGRHAILLTGTDEHGLKIQRAAAKAGLEPQEFCDRGAAVFRDLARQVDVGHDRFVRTTDAAHRAGVAHAWTRLAERGWISEGRHQGWYSVSDETFYPPARVELRVENATGRKIMVARETGQEVEWTSERNYVFALSAFRDRLLAFYRDHPGYVVPRGRMEEVVREVERGLEDLSVSRPTERLAWGVRVPGDEGQTIYVWLDALLNYATAAGYPVAPGREAEMGGGGWPADVQVVGKDIVRHHCIYWPAFLMALDLPLHQRVLTHAHWTLGKQKMAKSTGNGVDPFFALERFGIDPLRWYLIHEGGIAHDADYDNSFIIDKYKKGLQGGLGNLANRVMRGKGWEVAGAVKRYAGTSSPLHQELDERGSHFHHTLARLPDTVDAHMKALFPNRALQSIMTAVFAANAFLQHTSPWAIVTQLPSATPDPTGRARADAARAAPGVEGMHAAIARSIYLAAEALRLTGIMLQPFMPTAAQKQLDFIGVPHHRRSWDWCRLGADDDYGVSSIALGKSGLFPKLTSDF